MNAENRTKTSTRNCDRVLNLAFSVMLITSFLLYFIIQTSNLTLPIYADRLGATTQVVGLVSGIHGFAALLSRPISGQLADKENRVMLLRLVIISMLLSTFLVTIETGYYMLMISRFLLGFSWGVGSTTCLTMVSGFVPKHRLAFGIGIYGMGHTLAQCIAPAVSLPLSESIGYTLLYKYCCILLIGCFAFTFLLKKEYHQSIKSKCTINLKGMVCLSAAPAAFVNLCNWCAKITITTFLAIYSETLNIGGIAFYFTIQAFVLFVAAPFMSRLVDKLGAIKILIPCQILEFSSLLVVAYSSSIIPIYIAAVISGLGMAGEQPALMSESTRYAEETDRGRASNTYYIGTDLGVIIGSYFSGVLVNLWGYGEMFAIMSLFPLVGLAVFCVVNRAKVKNRHKY